MATKQFYATGSFKYGTRRLMAGDPVEMDAPSARLFSALGKISPNKLRGAARVAPAANMNDKTKAELAKMAGLSPAEAKRLTKAQIIAKL